MKITSECLQINDTESINWKDVKRIRMLNEKLALVLRNNKTIELSGLRPTQIDSAFRAFEKYLNDHPEKRKKKNIFDCEDRF